MSIISPESIVEHSGNLDYNASAFDRMAWFKAFRNEFQYTSYGENRSAANFDISLAAVIYASVLISVATLIATIGIRGKERWSTFLRVCFSLFIGASILVCIFGHGWQTGTVITSSYYMFSTQHKFNGSIGLEMGLDSVNITLTGSFGNHGSHVDYNERLHWFTVGQIQEEYQSCIQRGLPEPILAVASYFSFDDGGLRWGRGYSNAGYFAYILLWSSFSFWLVTNVLLGSVVFYGSIMFLLSGVTMVLSVVVYHVLQPLYPMIIPFEHGILSLRYDWSFWLMVAAGCVTTIFGIILLLLDWIMPKKLSSFFLVDSLFDEDEDEANHNLARSPNVNNLVPKKRSYLSLIEPKLTGNKLDCSRIDRQTSTINGEVRGGYSSTVDLRVYPLKKAHFHSQGCLTDASPMGSQARLVKADISDSINTSESSSMRSSIESLPFVPQELAHVTVDIPDEVSPQVHSPTVVKDTHF